MKEAENRMKEIILIKKSIFHDNISNLHLIETVKSFIEKNKEQFTERSWDCNIHTSRNIFQNILYDVEEFKYIKEEIEKKIKELIIKPFMITSSWLNILGKNGCQEFHEHRDIKSEFKQGSVSFYLTDKNSPIEFAYFTENIRSKIIPNQGDIIIFDSNIYHRVIDSKDERISLALNFRYL